MYQPYYEDFSDEREEAPAYDFLTPKEVMDELAIGRNTFYRLVNSGQLPAFRIGKLWRVKREDLARWKPSKP